MNTKRPGLIRRIFGGFWRLLTWTRLALANLLFLLVVIIMITAIRNASRTDALPEVPADAVLVLNPTGYVVEEQSFSDPLGELLQLEQGQEGETVLWDLIDAVETAADDERIRSMVIYTDEMLGAGITRTAEVASAIERFRAAGKRVVAVGDSFSQDQYLLAAQADEIWMHPFGSVDLSGYGSYRSYYADALEKLKIDVHVFRAGEFKSLYETLERNDMSDGERALTQSLLDDVWSRYTAEVCERRELPDSAVDDFANNLPQVLQASGGDFARAALDSGFVDELKDRNERRKALEELAGGDLDDHLIGFRRYLRASGPEFPLADSGQKSGVGVLVASGMIVDGETVAGQIGAETLSDRIHDAAEDDDIDALVLRVDSPGGSAFASEIIREALVDFRAQGKPLVVSMGSVAASGGYWISVPADQIWASETTLTGSIGVIGAFPSFARGLAELGVHSDGVGTTELAGALDPTRPISPVMVEVLQHSVEHTYDRFLTLVSEGRKIERDTLLGLAEGRVWSGAQAFESGLVDKLGRLDEAVAAAAEQANLGEDFETIMLEPELPWQVQLIRELGLSAQVQMRQWLLGVLGASSLATLTNDPSLQLLLNDPGGQYALCMSCPGS